jgi:RNA polymerase sigma-70 factor (ECF subfamily)
VVQKLEWWVARKGSRSITGRSDEASAFRGYEPEKGLLPLDEAVEAALVASRHHFMSRLVARLGSVSEAEDVFQDFALKVVAASDRVVSRQAIKSWLRTVLTNTLNDHFRRLRARRTAEAELRRSPGVENEEANERAAEAICECLHDLLQTLSADYRQVLQRVDLDGETIGEFARSLGISENAVSIRLYRARRAMRQRLKETCETCPEHGYMRCACERTGRGPRPTSPRQARQKERRIASS